MIFKLSGLMDPRQFARSKFVTYMQKQILACVKLCRLHFDSLIPVFLIRWPFACRLTQISDAFLRPRVCAGVYDRICASLPTFQEQIYTELFNSSGLLQIDIFVFIFFYQKHSVMFGRQKPCFPTKYLLYHRGQRVCSPCSLRYTHTTTHLTFVIITQRWQITVIRGLKQTVVNKQQTAPCSSPHSSVGVFQPDLCGAPALLPPRNCTLTFYADWK